jgi:tetratricopeptide (TPR) repeat protein
MPGFLRTDFYRERTAESSFRFLGQRLLFIHLLLSPLIFDGRSSNAFEYPKIAWLTLTALLLLSGGTAWWVATEKKSRIELFQWKDLFSEWTGLGLLLFFVSAVCSTVLSINWRTSLYGEYDSSAGLITIFSYTLLFIGTRMLCRESGSCRKLLIAVVLGVVGVTLYGTVHAMGFDFFTGTRTLSFHPHFRIYSTMGHANHMAAFLAMGLPIVCAFRLAAFEKGAVWIGAGLLLIESLAVALIVFSFSRSNWVATGIMLLVFMMGLVMITGRKRMACWLVFPSLLGLILGSSYFFSPVWVESPPLPVQRAAETAPLSEEASPVPEAERSHPLWSRVQEIGLSSLTKGSRWPIWTTAVAIFLDHPFLGVGLDNFQLAFGQYRPARYWLLEWGVTPTRAHNELLHILATQGLWGGLSYLLMTAGLWMAFVRAFRAARASVAAEGKSASGITPTGNPVALETAILPIAIFSGMVGFYIQNIFNFTVAGSGTLFFTLAAILVQLGNATPVVSAQTALSPAEVRVSPPLVRLAVIGKSGIILFLGIIAIYTVAYLPYRADTFYQSGYGLLVEKKPEQAILSFQEAIRLDPTKDRHFHYLGLAYQRAARKAKLTETRKELFTLAQSAHEKALRLTPIDGYIWSSLASVLYDMARESPPLAKKELLYRVVASAIALDLNNPEFYINGAEMAISFRDRQYAFEWVDQVATRYPTLAAPEAQRGLIALLDTEWFFENRNPVEAKRYALKSMDHLRRSKKMAWMGKRGMERRATNALAEAQFYLAQAHEWLGEYPEAEAVYRDLLTHYPNHSKGIATFDLFQKRMDKKKRTDIQQK